MIMVSKVATIVYLLLRWVFVVGIAMMIGNLIHELGHFLVAKRLKVEIEVFSIGRGDGDCLFSKKIRGCEFCIRKRFYNGAYVRLKEEPEDLNISKKEKCSLLRAGAYTNFIVVIILGTFLFVMGLGSELYSILSSLEGNILSLLKMINSIPILAYYIFITPFTQSLDLSKWGGDGKQIRAVLKE